MWYRLKSGQGDALINDEGVLIAQSRIVGKTTMLLAGGQIEFDHSIDEIATLVRARPPGAAGLDRSEEQVSPFAHATIRSLAENARKAMVTILALADNHMPVAEYEQVRRALDSVAVLINEVEP